jgi:hypothetical protein
VATYAQWRVNADKGEVRRITYCCGDQLPLVEEVVDTVRALLKVTAVDYVSLTAGTLPERDIWAACSQYPLEAGASRLVLVRDAQLIRNWDPLGEWLQGSRRLPTVYLLFVSADSDFPYQDGPDGKRGPLKAHAEWFRDRGHLIRCSYPSEEVLVSWIQRRAPNLDVGAARRILLRSGGDLGVAANVCQKLALFSTPPALSAIDQLCQEMPSTSFVDALIGGEPAAALSVAPSLPPGDYGRVIGLLDSRLDLLTKLYAGVRAGHTLREIGSQPGVPVFLVRQLMGVSRDYPPTAVDRRRRLLAVVDDSIRSGAKVGVLEALAALW